MPTVEKFLELYRPEVRAIALKARDLVFAVTPDAVETVYPGWKNIGYSASRSSSAAGMKSQFCYIAPLKAGVNLGFNRGAELPDPHGLLTGTGKLLRHVRITAPDQLDNPALRALLQAAAAHGT